MISVQVDAVYLGLVKVGDEVEEDDLAVVDYKCLYPILSLSGGIVKNIAFNTDTHMLVMSIEPGDSQRPSSKNREPLEMAVA